VFESEKGKYQGEIFDDDSLYPIVSSGDRISGIRG
jgi:hypothetical protein